MMLSLRIYIVLLMIFHLTCGTPVRKRVDRQQKLEELKREYRGVYWDYAASECTDEQFDILAETLRVVVHDMMSLAGTHFDRSRSSPFNRFFIRPVESGITGGSGQTNVMVDKYRAILEAMDSARKFPTSWNKNPSNAIMCGLNRSSSDVRHSTVFHALEK